MNIQDFLTQDIWQVQITTLPPWKRFGYRVLRTLMLISQGFTKNQIQQGASALTYYSMLSVVPIIALLIGIARGFLFEQSLEAWLLERFADQKLIIGQLFKFAGESLQAANGGIIAGVGIALLVWSAINILTNIELVMNQIWEVREGRSLARRFTDYLAMLFLAPILIFLASGLTGYLSALVSAVHKGTLFDQIAPFLIPALSLVSVLLSALLFTFLYIFMPNTRVRFLPALFAGIFTAVIYQILQWFYFYFQIGVASYNAIYGTFAAIPLFLIWLHLSWVMILLGAKLCFAIQNVDAFEFMSEHIHLSHRFRLVCSLRLAQYCVKKFMREESPPSALELSNRLAIPMPLTNRLLFQLEKAEVLVKVKRDHDQEEAYLPGRSPETLTIKRTIDMINERGEVIPLSPSHELTLILKNLEKFGVAMEESDANILLKDIK